MQGLEYSNEALNIKAAFYAADKMVYVEGEDDVIFWELIFKKFNKTGLKVEALGGIEELKKMITKIVDEHIDAAVARDADFTNLDPGYLRSPNVVTTYAHSIENTLITPASLHGMAKAYGRIPEGILAEEIFDVWLQSMEESFADLVLYDAANELGNFGENVLSNNCTRFMSSKSSPLPCSAKINVLIASLQNAGLARKLVSVKSTFDALARRVVDFMRGHFLASAAMKKVNHVMRTYGSSKAVNNDSFTSSLMLSFTAHFDNTHPHFEHYASQVALI